MANMADHIRRCQTVATLVSLSGFRDVSAGPPMGQSWPCAPCVFHQQTHLNWIRRAWEGGLRLMVASVVDSQPLALAWHNSLTSVSAFKCRSLGWVPHRRLGWRRGRRHGCVQSRQSQRAGEPRPDLCRASTRLWQEESP